MQADDGESLMGQHVNLKRRRTLLCMGIKSAIAFVFFVGDFHAQHQFEVVQLALRI